MFGTFANSPVLLKGYLGLEGVFEKGTLTGAERHLVLLAASIEDHCNYCAAAHSTALKAFLHVPAEVVSAVRSNLPLPDLKSNALVALTREMVAKRGRVEAHTIENFLAAGYLFRFGGEGLLAYNVPNNYSATLPVNQTPGQGICTSLTQDPTTCFRRTQDGYQTNFAGQTNFTTVRAQTRYTPQNFSTPYVQACHLSVQQELPLKMTLEVACRKSRRAYCNPCRL